MTSLCDRNDLLDDDVGPWCPAITLNVHPRACQDLVQCHLCFSGEVRVSSLSNEQLYLPAASCSPARE
jgi:hypothetical protein